MASISVFPTKFGARRVHLTDFTQTFCFLTHHPHSLSSQNPLPTPWGCLTQALVRLGLDQPQAD